MWSPLTCWAVTTGQPHLQLLPAVPLAPAPAPSGSSLSLVLRAVPSAGNTVDTTNATQAQAYTATVASILGLLGEPASAFVDIWSAFLWELHYMCCMSPL